MRKSNLAYLKYTQNKLAHSRRNKEIKIKAEQGKQNCGVLRRREKNSNGRRKSAGRGKSQAYPGVGVPSSRVEAVLVPLVRVL